MARGPCGRLTRWPPCDCIPGLFPYLQGRHQARKGTTHELDLELRPPAINSIFSRREVPENLWSKCDECGTMLFHRELEGNLFVCTNCNHHMAISPRDRFTALFDGGVFTEVKVPDAIADPLQFRDQKKYPDRLREARKTTGEKDAMLVADGEIGRTPIVAAAQDFSFMAGSLGIYVGNAIVAAAERAIARKCRWCCFLPPGARGCRKVSCP